MWVLIWAAVLLKELTTCVGNTTTSMPMNNDPTGATTTDLSTLTFTPSAKHQSINVTSMSNVTLNVTQKWEVILTMLLNTNLIIAFVVGAAFSASICSVFLCLAVKRKRNKETIRKDSDCKHPGLSLEVVTSQDQLMDAGPAVGGGLIPLCEKLNRGAETGVPQTGGVVEQSPSGQEPDDVNYASINISRLKTSPENTQKTTESDYAEIKRKDKKEGKGDGEEGGAVMEEEAKVGENIPTS